MNADHEEAVEFAKVSKRENRVYVGNLSYEVKYRDLIEFMRGGGWGITVFSIFQSCGKKWQRQQRQRVVAWFMRTPSHVDWEGECVWLNLDLGELFSFRGGLQEQGRAGE